MANDTKEVLCGGCKVSLQGPADAKPESIFSCPSCGRSDRLDNIRRIVGEFVRDETARYMQESTKRALRGSKMIKATYKPIPKRNYQFVVALDL